MSGMTSYFIRRLLLVPFTFITITFLVYSILRFVPGGPIEQAEIQMRMSAMSGEAGGGGSSGPSDGNASQLDEEAMEELKRYYALDKPITIGYMQWLGVWPREMRTRVPLPPQQQLKSQYESLSADQKALEELQAQLAEKLSQKPILAPIENDEPKEALEDVETTENEEAPEENPEPQVESIVVHNAKFYRAHNTEDVAQEIQDKVTLIASRTLDPELPEVQKLLEAQKIFYKAGSYYLEIPSSEQDAQKEYFASVQELAKQVEDKQSANKANEKTLGFFLEENKLRSQSFLPLIQLNEKKQEAQARLQEHLQAKSLVTYQKKLFRPLTLEERGNEVSAAAYKENPDTNIVQENGKYFRKASAEEEGFTATPSSLNINPEFFEQAESLVVQGYSKRTQLIAHLQSKNLYWDKDTFYVEVPASERAENAEYYETADIWINVVGYVGTKLKEIQKEYGFVINKSGLIYKSEERLSGIIQLDFGRSYTRGEPVLYAITSKFEVSMWFGLIGYLLSWIICVPLGVFKAIKHKSTFDSLTSVLVFLGYAIPGFLVCLILLTYVAVNVDWIPLGGYKPDNIEELSFFEGLMGRARHMLIPITGYMIGGFATMTILMKNSLMENLGQDYVRTALAKGLTEKRVIFVHALRNSLIPITAGIGHALGILFAGSFLIEKTCNIDGMGLLGYQAVVEKDYPIILGTLVFGVLIRLAGNIISDLVWSLIDPRIRFG